MPEKSLGTSSVMKDTPRIGKADLFTPGMDLINDERFNYITKNLYLGAKNTTSKVNAENTFRDFISKYSTTYKLYKDNIETSSGVEDKALIDTLESSITTLDSLRNSLHDLASVLDNTPVSQNLDITTLSSMKTQASTLLQNLELVILSPNGAGVKGSLESISTIDKDYNLKIQQLTDAKNLAEQDLLMAKTGKDIITSDSSKNSLGLSINVAVKKDSLNLAKISKDQLYKNIELIKQEKISKLKELDAKISELDSKISEVGSKKAETKMNIDLSLNAEESGVIRAPFDSVILSKNSDIGVVVGAGFPLYSVTSTDSKIVNFYFDNSEAKLVVGSEINTYNLSKAASSTGKILEISSVKDSSNNKYKTKASLLDGSMFGYGDKINIQLNVSASDKKSIIIPNNSIITKYSEPGVFVLENGKANFKLIKVIKADSFNTSIEGLNLGDIIITEGKDNILDSEILK